MSGADRYFKTDNPSVSVRTALSVLRSEWPDLFLECVYSGHFYRDYEEMPHNSNEFFLYKDNDAFALWDEHGPTLEETKNLMLHFLLDDRGFVTVVADDWSRLVSVENNLKMAFSTT